MSKSKYLFVEYLNDVNSVVNKPLQVTQRIKYTCFDVSAKYVLFGATSGGIYVFQKNPYSFLRIIPSKEGAIAQLCVSPDERTVAATNPKGWILIFQGCITDSYTKPKIFTELEGNVVTAMKWHKNSLYVGDNTGKVSIVNIKNSLASAIFQSSFFCMVSLESSIVQVDALGKFVLISTKTRTILVDTETGQFAQIGKKLRNGIFGACFYTPNRSRENDIPPITIEKSSSFLGGLGLDDSDEEPIEEEDRIFCARPGCRLWEVNFDPTVLSTHQFKYSLAQFPSRIIEMDEEKDHRLNLIETSESDYVSPEQVSFERLQVLDNKFIMTFNSEGIYILDVLKVSVVFWTNKFKNIRDVKSCKNNIFIWHGFGNLNVLTLHELESFILDNLFHKRYYICSELCQYFMSDVLNFIELSERLRLLSYLKNKLQENDPELIANLQPIFDRIEEINTMTPVQLPQETNINKKQLTNQNLDKEGNEVELESEPLQTLIDFGSTVMENTVNVIEKLQILHETVVNLTSTETRTHDDNREENENSINNNTSQEIEEEVEDIDPFKDKETTLQTIFKSYQLCKGRNEVVNIPKLNEHFANILMEDALKLGKEFKDFIFSHNDDENEGIKAKNEGIKIKNEGIKIENEGIKAENEGIKAENEGIKAKNEGIKAGNEGINAKNEGIKAENEGIKAKNEGIKAKNEGIKAENEGINAKNEGIKAENEGIKAKNEGIKAENEAIKAENEEINAKNEGIKAKNEGIKAENEGIKAEKEEAYLWYLKQYLTYFSSSNLAEINDVLSQKTDEDLLLLFEAFSCVQQQNSFSSYSSYICQCKFPLPQARLNVPSFDKLGCALLQFSVNNKQERVESFLSNHPYFWKHFLTSKNKSVKRENEPKLLPLLIQISDVDLISSFAKSLQFGCDDWDVCLQLLVKLHKGFCLNCENPIKLEMKTKDLLSWTEAGKLLLRFLGGKTALKLLMRYSNHIPNGTINEQFYQSCIFAQTFCGNNEDDERIRMKSIKLIGEANESGDTNTNKWNKILTQYLQKSDKVASKLHFLNAPCSNCDLPISSDVLRESARVNCGHFYHKFCILELLHNKCKVCDVTVVYPCD